MNFFEIYDANSREIRTFNLDLVREITYEDYEQGEIDGEFLEYGVIRFYYGGNAPDQEYALAYISIDGINGESYAEAKERLRRIILASNQQEMPTYKD